MHQKKEQSIKKQNQTAALTGFIFFFKANSIIILTSFLFLINYTFWNWDGLYALMIFVLFPQPFFVLLAFIDAFQNNRPRYSYSFSENPKNSWIGFGYTIIFIMLFSLIFLGAGIPFPSTIVFLMITTNLMVATFSIIFHPFTIVIYEANVFKECHTTVDYLFKYIVIFTSSINYHIQRLLQTLPLLWNKIFAILFVVLLIWQLFGVISIFSI